jgi:spore coat polysaccharide biosynthesis predicted glycosyltransferase SpsG
VLRGPAFAVVDPQLTATRAVRRRRPRRASVLVALGGGPRATYARRLARTLTGLDPHAHVTVAAGFAAAPPRQADARVTWLGPQASLAPWLASATVAIVGGGVTAYEACSLGVPTVVAPVVRLQWRAARALSARGALLTPRARSTPPPVRAVASRVATLLGDAALRARLSARARALVDGHGARRVARILEALACGEDVAAATRAAELRGIRL